MFVRKMQRMMDKAGAEGDKSGASGGDGGGGDLGKGGGSSDAEARLKKLEQQLEETTGELERFQAKHKEAEKHRKEAERAAREQEERAAKESGNIEALEKSWKEKLEAREKELAGEIEQLRGSVQDLTAGQTATNIANELAVPGSAKTLLPHIRSRLTTEVRDGKPTVVVLDQEGRPSAKTLDELKDEIRRDEAFKPVIVGSKASGSGGSAGSAAGGGNTVKRSELDAMAPKERAKLFKDNPDTEVIDD